MFGNKEYREMQRMNREYDRLMNPESYRNHWRTQAGQILSVVLVTILIFLTFYGTYQMGKSRGIRIGFEAAMETRVVNQTLNTSQSTNAPTPTEAEPTNTPQPTDTTEPTDTPEPTTVNDGWQVSEYIATVQDNVQGGAGQEYTLRIFVKHQGCFIGFMDPCEGQTVYLAMEKDEAYLDNMKDQVSYKLTSEFQEFSWTWTYWLTNQPTFQVVSPPNN
jgi:hypothetical protein